MSVAHTPGPWRVDMDSLHAYWTDSISVVRPDGGAICCTTRGGGFFDEHGERAPAWPNAHLIAAAPQLLEALQWREQFEPRPGETPVDLFERIAELFQRETGYLRPGKDCRMYSTEERQAVWSEWMNDGRARVRAAIAAATGAAA